MLTRLILTAVLMVSVSAVSFPVTSDGNTDPQEKQITGALERYVKTRPIDKQPWDEQTTPLLEIQDISHQSTHVALVHACEFQPTIMAAGVRIEATVLRTHRDWRVTSFSHVGPCRPKIGAPAVESHNSEIQR